MHSNTRTVGKAHVNSHATLAIRKYALDKRDKARNLSRRGSFAIGLCVQSSVFDNVFKNKIF